MFNTRPEKGDIISKHNAEQGAIERYVPKRVMLSTVASTHSNGVAPSHGHYGNLKYRLITPETRGNLNVRTGCEICSNPHWFHRRRTWKEQWYGHGYCTCMESQLKKLIGAKTPESAMTLLLFPYNDSDASTIGFLVFDLIYVGETEILSGDLSWLFPKKLQIYSRLISILKKNMSRLIPGLLGKLAIC